MRHTIFGWFAALMILCAPALAETRLEAREAVGVGRLFTNDHIGDGKDRWRTGSYVISVLRGPEWSGSYPNQSGDLIEYRFRSEIITPEILDRTVPDDRRFVGISSVGLHTHFRQNKTEISLGADAVFIGEQTGLGEFQENIHARLGQPEIEVLDDQLGSQTYLTGLLEIGQPHRPSGMLTLRPFFEAQAGVESLIRFGGDLHWGPLGQTDLWVRDVTTGQRYRATIEDKESGVALNLGGDIAFVGDSIYLPGDGGAELKRTRSRVRAGITVQRRNRALFYGLTYLSEEFEEQDEGQFVGSIRVNFRF